MAIGLFAGIPVKDYAAALAWCERLLGSPPAFLPDVTEAVWELAEHRYLYIDVRPEHAGHAMVTLFVDDFDALIAQITGRGIEPTRREVYDNGVRKTTFHDPEGNEIDALDRALDALYASVPEDPAIGDEQTGIVNRAQLRLGRILNSINYSRMEPSRHDPAMTVAPLPDLTPALSAEKAGHDPAKLGVLKAHLTRGQNRIVWALQLAREEAERATV